MPLKEDIMQRINLDFGAHADEAVQILVDVTNRVDYLKSDRVIRCITFLAKGKLADLKKYIEAATTDPRDIMLWAEYEKLPGDSDFTRVRDFNKTFETSEIRRKE